MWVRPPLCQMNPKYGQETAPNLFGPDFTRFWIFFTFSVFPENTVHNQYMLYTVPVRMDFFIRMFWSHTHVWTVHICLSPLQRCYIFSNRQSTTAVGQSMRAQPSHNSTHVLICSRTVRGSPHGQSDPTLGQSVCNSWQPISSWPTSSVILTVYVCFMHNIATHEQHVTYVWHFIHIRAETTEDVTIESKSEYVNEPKPVEPMEHQGRLLSISPFYNCITDYAIPICICIYRILWLDSVAHLVELSSLLFTTLPWSIACFTF